LYHTWERNAYTNLFGKSEGNRPFGKLKHRRYGNLIDLEEVRWEGVNWFMRPRVGIEYMAGSCEQENEPSVSINSGNLLTS
jgi:hypothetical protein